jgi:hypothetical protein
MAPQHSAAGLALPLPPNVTQTAKVIGISATFYGMAAIACVLRIYTRIRPHITLGFEDYFLMVSFVCPLPVYRWSYLVLTSV